MTYPQTLAEISRLERMIGETKDGKLKKHYKKQARKLKEQRNEYETSFYGKKLGN